MWWFFIGIGVLLFLVVVDRFNVKCVGSLKTKHDTPVSPHGYGPKPLQIAFQRNLETGIAANMTVWLYAASKALASESDTLSLACDSAFHPRQRDMRGRTTRSKQTNATNRQLH
jgi:hypothetical protein